jgi:hypothetical protein
MDKVLQQVRDELQSCRRALAQSEATIAQLRRDVAHYQRLTQRLVNRGRAAEATLQHLPGRDDPWNGVGPRPRGQIQVEGGPERPRYRIRNVEPKQVETPWHRIRNR